MVLVADRADVKSFPAAIVSGGLLAAVEGKIIYATLWVPGGYIPSKYFFIIIKYPSTKRGVQIIIQKQ